MSTPIIACSEHELIAAVRSGSDSAFEELFARYHARILTYVGSRLHDTGRAEDLAQDVFISALRRLRQTHGPVMFKPWIYEIAKNACIDEFRRSRHSHEVSLQIEDGGEAHFAAPGPTPEGALEGKQSLSDLRAAFMGLPESQHRVLVMRELEGLSYAEIAERTGVSGAVVESTLFRARQGLSREYEALASGRRCRDVQALIAPEAAGCLLKRGVRQRRRLAVHLSHCQPCRHRARLAGVDDSLFVAPPRRGAKLGALLPLPLPWLSSWRTSRRRDPGPAGAGGHAYTLPWERLGQVAQLLDPVSGSLTGFGRLAGAAATIAVAGLGGGVLTGLAASAVRNPAPPPQRPLKLAGASARRTGAGATALAAPPSGSRSGHGLSSAPIARRGLVIHQLGSTGAVQSHGAGPSSDAAPQPLKLLWPIAGPGSGRGSGSHRRHSMGPVGAVTRTGTGVGQEAGVVISHVVQTLPSVHAPSLQTSSMQKLAGASADSLSHRKKH